MGTPYKFEVTCCSAFCAYSEKQIADIIYNALNNFEDETTHLKLESIEVSSKKEIISSRTKNFKTMPPDFATWIKTEINPMRVKAGLEEMSDKEIEDSKEVLQMFHNNCKRPIGKH